MSESCFREHAVCNIEGQNMYASTQPCLFLIKARLGRGARQVKGGAMYRGASSETKERGFQALSFCTAPSFPVFLNRHYRPTVVPVCCCAEGCVYM